jgi:hypothetical protein
MERNGENGMLLLAQLPANFDGVFLADLSQAPPRRMWIATERRARRWKEVDWCLLGPNGWWHGPRHRLGEI